MALICAALIAWSEIRYEREESITPFGPRPETPPRRPDRQIMLPPVWPCGARPEMPTIAQAHTDMQEHQECSIDRCARKREARYTLINAGVLKPRGLRR